MIRRIYAALMIVISLLGSTATPQQSTLPQSSSNTVEQTQVNSTKEPSSLLTKSEAEAIALNSLGLLPENVRMERTELDREKGRTVWEVEFYYGTTEYDIEVNAITGEITKTDYEEKNRPVTNLTPSPEPTPVSPPTADKTVITKEQALAIALSHAVLTQEQVTKLKIEKDREDGVWVYEIEFRVDYTEYDYKVHAVTGVILKHEKETDTPKTDIKPTPQPTPKPDVIPDTQPVTEEITKEKAVEIALAHAELSKDQVKKLKVEKDREDGVWVYEIEFRVDYTEYDYKVHAVTGVILKHEKETDTPKTDTKPTPKPTPKPDVNPDTQPVTEEITKEKAVEIALAHAELSKDQVKKLKAEKDREDGVWVYEIEFDYGNKEFEYEIRTSDGTILKFDEEFDD